MTTHANSDTVHHRLRPRSILLGAAGALLLAGCGASAATPNGQHNGNHSSHSGSASTLVITNPEMIGHNGVRVVTVKSGTNVEFELVSSSYHRDHTIAPWGTPQSSASAVLAPISTPKGTHCPANATCTFFAAKGVGTATVSAIGPSGILCGKTGGGCIAITAIIGQIHVHVTKA